MNAHRTNEKRGITLSVFRLAKAGVLSIYHRHVEPKSQTEDLHRRELMLNVILLGSICLLSALDITILYEQASKGPLYDGTPFWAFSLLVALFTGLYALSRKGFLRASSYALVTLYFLGTSASAYAWGASLPANLLGYALVITLSSVLISSRFGFALATLTFVTLITLGWTEIGSGAIPDWKQRPVTIDDILAYALILIVMALISWLSNRETEHSLARARRSEAELMLEKQSLETRVSERTRELRQAQMDGMSQLARFAEFGKLSSGLFHDLVSPLSAIILNLQGIESSGNPDIKSIQDKLEKSVRASRRMDSFISCIKRQMRSDDFEEEFSANDMIEDALGLFHYKALRAHVDLSFEAGKSITLFGNPLRFHQIASNLISNAIDSYDSAAHLRHGREAAKKVRVSLEENRGRTIITVRDQGVGMSPETLSRMFEPFFTTKSRDVAMGIGLSTTKEIVQKDFGGAIRVQSEQGKGTTFVITLPDRREKS